jgi:hypothetical protein
VTQREPHLEPTQESGREFFLRGIEGEIVMLNLLRFRDVADHSETPDLQPDEPISGKDAYDRYIEHTLPFLHESGGAVDFMGDGGAFFVGPADERWDLAMLVRHRSVETFMSFAQFAQDEAYLGGMGHRLAAVADSRLLPLVPR